ncbi:hypothetical protein RAS1_02820 [Phycisphaerae bacterium RAS1]|nr:hypothetical protein RAS1_02820 [Phycisphaerae bacterium RAS1]
MKTILSATCVALLAAAAPADSNIDTTDRFAWSENAGWLNWRDAGDPAGSSGVRIGATFLSGFIWAENVGWINLGDGAPGSGGGTSQHYANLDGADFGVNRDPLSDELFGYAWSENGGWINFDGGAAAMPANPARIDTAGGACRLGGFAWAENLGWINLDDAAHFVALDPSVCGNLPGDMNCDGAVNVLDINPFVLALSDPIAYAAMFPGCNISNGDIDGDGSLTVLDINPFVALLSGG